MALKAIILGAKLEKLRKSRAELETREAALKETEEQLRKAFEEITEETPQEEREVVESKMLEHDGEVENLESEKKKLDKEIEDAEAELSELEDKQEDKPAEEDAEERSAMRGKENNRMDTRTKKIFGNRSAAEIEEIVNERASQEFLATVRDCIANKREITNAGLLIPQNYLGVLRDRTAAYSKLMNRTNFQKVRGTGRITIAANIMEGVWQECCSILNETSLAFNGYEVDCFKVGSYTAVCNATLHDSDALLAAEIIDAFAKGNALAVDKAIVFGRNTDGNSKMPQGFATSVLQTSQPAGYPTYARTWVDIHTSNVLEIGTAASPLSGVALMSEIVLASGIPLSDFAAGNVTWIMNKKTHTEIKAAMLAVNAAGAVVSSVGNTMPVADGDIVELSFMPDGVIAFGYLENYLMVEREGFNIASSEHVRFLADQTVFKGEGRYDGAPVVREAFAIILLNGGTLDAATDITFPQDTANA